MVENYPGLIIEKARIDDLMEYMIKGNCMKGLLVKDFLLMIKSKKVILFMLFIESLVG